MAGPGGTEVGRANVDGSEKPCRICGVIKPLADFVRNRQRADGRGSYCRPCWKTKYGDPIARRHRGVRPVTEGTQQCRICSQVKPVTEFYWQADKGRRAKICIPCRSEQDRRTRDPVARRRRSLGRYGLTPEQYDELLAAQDGMCAICGRTENPDGGALAVDHCHTAGHVRGILCGPCNKAIGLLSDDPDLLLKAAEYLRAR